MISIDYSMILVIVNFLLLLYILNKYVYKNAKRFLAERAERIKDDLDSAKKSKNEAKDLLDKQKVEVKQIAEDARKQRRELISKADFEAVEIIDKAKKREKQIKIETEQMLVQEQKKATDSLKKSLSELIVRLSSKLVSDKIDTKQDEALIRSLIAAGKGQ